MKKVLVALLLLLILAMALPGCGPTVVKIGLIAEITGSMPAVGRSGQTAAKLAVKQINNAGGIKIGGTKYKIELVVEDSAAEPAKAAAAAKKLIEKDGVLAIVGPNSSSNAVAAADVADNAGVLLIAPWSTNPKTTIDEKTGKPKKTIYRACFTDYFESEALGVFVSDDLKAQKAAILFDNSTDVLKNQAQLFTKSFEANGGKVVAVENFKAGDKDYSAQLDRIKAAGPDILFLPSYYTDVAAQVTQARAKGITATFIGSDAWSTPELIKMAGANIEGSYLFNHYSSESPAPLTQKFVKDYKAAYNNVPDDVAALNYDSFGMLAVALSKGGALNRTAVLDGMSKVTDYKGATGTMRFEKGLHDPIKSGVVIVIKGGKFQWFANVEPVQAK
ncbi:MAG: ABC transporter substrate-binding protein [Candidatus Geothermincolia bacterium]